MMTRQKITMVFTIKTEFVPGMFYDPKDFVDYVAFKALREQVGHYDPQLISVDCETEES